MSLSNLFMTLIVAVAIISFILLRRKALFASTIALLSLVVFAYSFNSLPALATPSLAALGAKD
ncbi:MAG: hypothetical protein SWZ49_15170, partial [Cyanobacteriota bacterium]|nr:hypothetical protein [Cyanobacteriota bacterium]